MNANKKNIMSGGWILCPSKTFPGKFYYFNVLNGEAAWSLGDAEKKIIKTIPKVQESHHHPEPSSPPTMIPSIPNDPMIPKFSLQHPKPIFGQSVFPKVLSKPEPYENLIWTPIQIEVPIVVPSEGRLDAKSKPVPKAVKPKTKWDFNNDLFIHSCSTPLSKRFVNFENPTINFDKDNKIQNKLQFDEFFMSQPEVKATMPSNDVFQKKGLGFSNIKPQKQLIKEAVFNIEVPSENLEVDTQIEPKLDSDEVDFGIKERQNIIGGDLRNLLMAKKRKSQVMNSEEVESKKLKTTMESPKKKVSFNLDHEEIEFDDNEMNFREQYSSTVQVLRNLSRTVVDEWCIVVDGEILLDEFSFLDKLVQLDPHCKLVIPSSALSYVRAASRGARAAAARSLLRRLDTPYIVVQSDDVTGISPNDDNIQSCVDAMYRNIHVVLISKNIELLANAKCCHIHCYHISTIKNGLAPKPVYKQNMKITIRNAEANLMQNSPAENDEGFIEREKETLKYKQHKVNLITNECTPVDTSNSMISTRNSNILNKNSLFEQSTRNTTSNALITNLTAPNLKTNLVMSSQKINLQDLKTMYPINSQENSNNSINSQNKNTIQDSNINSKSLNHLFNTTKEVFNKIAKKDENKPKMLTDWRYAESDNTETTIEMDFQNLNLKGKYQTTCQKEKLNKNVYFTHHSTPKINIQNFNRTPIFKNVCKNVQDSNYEVQKSNFKTTMLQNNDPNVQDSNFEVQKSHFKTAMLRSGRENVPNSNYEVQKSNFQTAMFQSNGANVQDSNFEIQTSKFKLPTFQDACKNVQDSNFEVQKSNFETSLFQRGRNNVRDSNFEIQKSNYISPTVPKACENLQASNFEVQTSNIKTNFQNSCQNLQDSNIDFQKEPQFLTTVYENDVFKKPNKPLNWTKINNNIDLSNFYVKNKVMDSRLKERIDEFVCTYKQIMEEFLSSILEKLSPSAFKSMAPPWSLYEGLQCAKNIYKDHVMVKNIIDQLSGFLYESDCKRDKMKMAITPSEFMKAVGCGVYLIQYLKKILQPSSEILDSEQHLMDMIKQIENPVFDINEPLVKTPVECNADYKEIRQNFVKNRSDIISYLKKHYPDWQNYEEIDSKMKIVRTFGRNLNMLKLERVKDITMTGDTDVLNSVVMKNIDGVTKNTDVMKNVESGTNDVGKMGSNGKASLKCSKIPTFKDTTKNVGVFVVKEADTIIDNIEPEERVRIVQEKSNIIKKNDQNKTSTPSSDSRNIDGIENSKPKTKSIFDFVIPKDKNEEKRSEKFNIRDILGVKITIPNKEILKDVGIEKDGNRYDTDKSLNRDKNKCVRKLNMNVKDDNDNKTKEMNKKNENKDKPQAIKIIRNIHLIEEFEKRLKNKKNLELGNLDYSSISSTYTDDETYLNTNSNNDQINIDQTDRIENNNFNDHVKDINGHHIIKNVNDKPYEDKANHYNENNDIKINEKQKEPKENHLQNKDDPKIRENDPKNDTDDPRSDGNDPKTNANERKSDKDDMTNDSGLGNDSPRVYSVVKSFSFELESSLEHIRTYIDGSLQEFRQGTLSEETKKMFRLKAFETNFLVTRIISRLNKLVQNCEVSNEKIISKNAEVMSRCLEQAEVLQKALNMILTVTNESSLVELNSSMSLNLSS